MTGFEYMTIAEVASKLKHNQTFAVAWCINNNVTLRKIGNKNVVSAFEFKYAFELPFIQDLRKKYPENWEEVYQLQETGDVVNYHKLINRIKAGNVMVKFDTEAFLKRIGFKDGKI